MERVPAFITVSAGIDRAIPLGWNNIAIIPGANGVTVTNSAGDSIIVYTPITFGSGADPAYNIFWDALTFNSITTDSQLIVDGDVKFSGSAFSGSSGTGIYIPFSSQNYRAVYASGNAVANGVSLRSAVIATKLLTPNGVALSDSNRAVVYLFAGVYDMGALNISLGEFVDVIGVGESKDIVITSTDSAGTIKIANANNYILKNLSINNTGSGGSITHNVSQVDNGIWKNLILYAPNTVNTIFAGNYSIINGLCPEILNGSIAG